MAYTRKQLEGMKDLQLQAIARSEFNLSVDLDTTAKAPLIEMILEAQEAQERLQEPAAEIEVPPPQKRFRLVIHNQEGVDNTPFVSVGINGFVYQIPREVEVKVPQEVVTILTQAEQTVPETDEKGRVVGHKTVKRFPFSVLGEAAA